MLKEKLILIIFKNIYSDRFIDGGYIIRRRDKACLVSTTGSCSDKIIGMLLCP